MDASIVFQDPIVNFNVDASQIREEGPSPLSNSVLALISKLLKFGHCALAIFFIYFICS